MKTNFLLLLFAISFLFSACKKEEDFVIKDSIVGTWRWVETIEGTGSPLTPKSTGQRIYLVFTEEGEYTKIENGEVVEQSTYTLDESSDLDYLVIEDISNYRIQYTEAGLNIYNFAISTSALFSTSLYQPQ